MSGQPGSASSSAENSLEDWIRQLQAGQPEALEPLIEHTQGRAWQIAYAILQNRQEVEDALQDAYLLVYQNIGQLRESKAFWGWFKRLLVHRCLRLHKRVVHSELPEETAVPAEASEVRLDIHDAFARLSLSDRTVLGLREILDYTYEEISQLLEVPLTTVKTRLYNARNRFCKFFARDIKGDNNR
ncbi:MAG: sigma-70 family RNA polymerase sigma factor [Candidatus Eremiobacteraeota bacterium]|nr:sigma-70 family RNA polymerase sigma factor [Candidatus Eremiobacteraeota bacterium]MCW5869508.1 sigma-70 family RNA polymerase sigma factor [Candidatus Eremiobacteraeota bacterium]